MSSTGSSQRNHREGIWYVPVFWMRMQDGTAERWRNSTWRRMRQPWVCVSKYPRCPIVELVSCQDPGRDPHQVPGICICGLP